MKTLVSLMDYFVRGTGFFFVCSLCVALIFGKSTLLLCALSLLLGFASMSLITAAIIGFMYWLQYRREKFIKCFRNGYVSVLLAATLALAYGFYHVAPMLSAWWQQALAILGVLVLEDVLAFVISWRIILIWKRSNNVYDTRIIGIAVMFYICYIASSIFLGIYALMTNPWLFLTTIALVFIFGLLGVGIVNAPYRTMKKFDKFIEQ